VEIIERPHPNASQPIPFNKDTIEALLRWKARHDASQKQVGDFVETSVWDRVNGVYKRAYRTKKMFFCFGEAQIGKTRCAKELSRRYNTGQTTYVDMPPGAGAQFMLRCIAKALHVNSQTAYQNLMEDVCDALDPSKALILDNMHRVFTTYQKGSVMRCMDTLLYIYDTTGCVMGIFATNVFADRLEEGEFFKYLKQFKRRGVYEVHLEDEPTRADLDLVAARYGLASAEERAEEIMLDIAHTDGFGKFCTRLLDAQHLAEKAGRTIAWSDFVKAHGIAEKVAKKPVPEKKH
jgi:DNA transposition AAA+ family ATPase